MKKYLFLVLAVLMVLSVAVPAMAQRADTVVYAGTQQYLSLVPFLNPKTYTAAVFEPLGSFTTYGADFQGIMMESWEYDGDRTYTVKLYDNIHDSAGNPITAEDVVFCYAFEQVGSSEQANVIASIESVTAIDDLTVQFVWKSTPVIGAFEHALSYVNIVDKDAYIASGDGMATAPIGTGPYVVESWTSGVTMTLKVNENYWPTPDQIKLPRQQQPVETIVINTISETSQLTMALQTDTIDMTNNLATQDVPNFEEGGRYADKYTVEKVLWTAPKSLLVNHSPAAKTSDPYLRMAIMAAIDNELIAWMVNGGANVPTYGFGSPMNPDYDEEAFKSYMPVHDINKAKEYLKQSAYPNGCEINLIFIDGGMANDIAELIQGQLAEIGIKVNIKGSIFPNWLAAKNDETAWDLNLSELSGFYVTDLWESAFIKQNETFATEEELAALQPLVLTALSVEGHTQEAVNAAQQYITENGFVIPLLVEERYNVFDSSLIESVASTGEGAVCVQGFIFK